MWYIRWVEKFQNFYLTYRQGSISEETIHPISNRSQVQQPKRGAGIEKAQTHHLAHTFSPRVQTTHSGEASNEVMQEVTK
jgi:hypothetical protein